ncbi:hypothetical protein AMECASPLE_034920 [Ameca splendens]|uniref:Uncharacterized protein n=1 Tax=Ameca splendens TaxID=208324 RepID=A0ABV1ADL5_9TELE
MPAQYEGLLQVNEVNACDCPLSAIATCLSRRSECFCTFVVSFQMVLEFLRTHSTAQVNHLDFLRFTHLGPNSLNPWGPDFTLLFSLQLAILPFTFQYHFVNKTPFTNSVMLLSVLVFVGQIYFEQNVP